MKSQLGKQTIAIHVLPNILKVNSTMKVAQLIEYSIKNIFLEKPYTNVMKKLFSKKSKFSISLDQ